jgi:3-dehydroquinate synthetase
MTSIRYIDSENGPTPDTGSTAFVDCDLRFGDVEYRYLASSGPAAWDALVLALSELGADRFAVVTERSVPDELVSEVCAAAGTVAPTTRLDFEGGERAKTIATVDTVARGALEAGVTRRSCVLAVGGGLAGNVAGLLAALLFRGIRFVQIPTTLLAMSDSVLSLKQAVNSKVGKNHVGTFYTPQFVWSNVDFLAGLPVIERKSAMCEVVKNVLAVRPDHYEQVAELLKPACDYTREDYLQIIALAIGQKTSVMAGDAFEKGDALVLEYGHTVGHALEVTMAGELPHGLAVGLGMVVAARCSELLGIAAPGLEDAHHDLLGRLGAHRTMPASADTDAVMALVGRDNKRGYLEPRPGMHDMVLLEDLGRPVRTVEKPLTPVPTSLVRIAIEQCRDIQSSVAPPRRRIGRRAGDTSVVRSSPVADADGESMPAIVG